MGQALKVTGSAVGRTYTVQSGDSLWQIAQSQLGNGARYQEIKALNGLSDDTIYPGQSATAAINGGSYECKSGHNFIHMRGYNLDISGGRYRHQLINKKITKPLKITKCSKMSMPLWYHRYVIR